MGWRTPPPSRRQMLLAGMVTALLAVVLGALLPRITPQWLSSSVTATAAALATAAVVGLTYLNLDLTRHMVWHFRETREGQFRPYLVTRWLPRVEGGHAAIEVELLGMAAARCVSFNISPPTLRTPAGELVQQLPLLQHGLDVLPQGSVLVIPVDPASIDDAAPVRIVLTYQDFYVPPRDYRETFTFRPAAFQGLTLRRTASGRG